MVIYDTIKERRRNFSLIIIYNFVFYRIKIYRLPFRDDLVPQQKDDESDINLIKTNKVHLELNSCSMSHIFGCIIKL